MKTFLAVATGLLTGFIGGVAVTQLVFLNYEGYRKYLNDSAEELNNM